MTSPSSIVKLNVGGFKYLTTVHTLTAHGDNFFSKLLDPKSSLNRLVDEDGCTFIDRDGEYFKPLLSFLRTGELVVPGNMSRRLLEKEAMFYGLNLNYRAVSDPQCLTGSSSAIGLRRTSSTHEEHNDLRYDGIYLHRSNHSFIGYYTFTKDDRVFYKSLTSQRNDMVYSRPARFVRLKHPWLIMFFGSGASRARTSRAVCTVNNRGLTVQWRYPPRSNHRRTINLVYYPSLEPLINVLYSDERFNSTDHIFIRLFFHDLVRVTVTLVIKSTDGTKEYEAIEAQWQMEWRDDQCHVSVICESLEIELQAHAGFLVVNHVSTSKDSYDFSSACVRMMCAVDCEPDAEPEIQSDVIDVYTFLRGEDPEPFFPETTDSDMDAPL